MSLREQLLKEIEQTPDALLGELIEYIHDIKLRTPTNPVEDRIETRIKLLSTYGRDDLPVLAEGAEDRDTLYPTRP